MAYTSNTLEGTLSKWTNVMKGWQYRFFVLDENAGLLSYYTSREKMMKGARRGCVRLKDAVIGIDDQEDNTFTITVDHKTFHFQAQHAEEREKWVRRLEDTIRRHANRSRFVDTQSTFYLGGYNKEIGGSKPVNHLELLSKRISEADAYLQLMIEQTNKVEQRFAELEDPEEQAKCKVITTNANAMLDHIKHSIVSLQIAKNMAHPINGIYNGPTTSNAASKQSNLTLMGSDGDNSQNAENLLEDEDDSTTENDENSLNSTHSAVSPLSSSSSASASTKTKRAHQHNYNKNNNSLPHHQRHRHQQPNPAACFPSNLHYMQYAATQHQRQQHQQLQQPFNDHNPADDDDDDCDAGVVGIRNVAIDAGIEHGGNNCRLLPLSSTTANTAGEIFLSSNSSSSIGIAGVTTAPLAMVVPETSYSSSEGEDDFYDANYDPYTSMGSSPITNATRGFSLDTSPTHDELGNTAATTTTTTTTTTANTIGSKVTSNAIDEYKTPSSTVSEGINNAAGIDYDALYEEEEDTNLSMEAHGSMISHLLSQVKIGMDLTKVVLPTFILERRSLLEMYADYFAHPDLFLKIAEMDSPRDRIVQVCRWYLSAYHAGRKSAVAKKPYNPILGEIFQCHWDIPGEPSDIAEVADGPIPWCHRDQLTFLAEQVSHHPPISAFYAEHYNKKITFSAHVWTKSKFLGLSIGVHNIGEGIVTLVDRSEEYIVTFPNGYGRSILTVPWIELGGSVEIRCPQTGYYANVEFLTKPFYGGKRNKVTAEIYSPNEKKPFVSIAGEWSGLMEAKWHDKNKTEVFVDVNRIPIFKKQVRPIVEQEEYESRRVWKEVTAGLKFNDIEKATKAKCDVEQFQRDQAKSRKDNEELWEHKYFKPVGENWIYTKPLSQRVYLQEKEAKR